MHRDYHLPRLGLLIHLLVLAKASHLVRFTDDRQASYVARLPSYTISIPRLVQPDGSHLSHDVRHAHARYARSTAHAQNRQNSVHYRFNVTNGAEVHVELRLNEGLLSPGLVVERRRGNVSRIVQHDGVHCHYTGGVRGREESKVALSTCTGLRGYINSPHGHFFIEPVIGYPPDHVAGQPHVVYPASNVVPGHVISPNHVTAGHAERYSRDPDDGRGHEDHHCTTQGSPELFSGVMIPNRTHQSVSERKSLLYLGLNYIDGKAFDKFKIGSKFNSTFIGCALSCRDECTAFNFHEERGACEILKMDSELVVKGDGSVEYQKGGLSDTFESSRDDEAKRERSKRDASQHRSRHKRSFSKERYVETLVVVDSLMLEYYAQDDVQMYILTVMNMNQATQISELVNSHNYNQLDLIEKQIESAAVNSTFHVAAIYHDVSVGNSINIVLVRLILLEEPEAKLQISHHADKTLDSFCKWQKTVNPKDDKHPNHHDTAVLATRFNICSQKDKPCSTLGMAQVAGMCQMHRSCSVNQDTGLALAYTIAHEIGHNFNMKHDEAKNGCEAPYQIRQHVMSPQLVSDSTPLIWSNCSRESITKFLDRDWGFCLDDEPQAQPFTFPAVPPGVMYDADHQCRLQYGQGAELCEGIEEICSTLWCKVDKKCMTRLEAAVEGTYCDRKDKNKWCIEGQCSLITERDEAVDGMWGAWSEWSECSRTCGAGVSNAVRHCDHPAPSNGGKYCIGERKRFRICNTDVCPEGGVSFRQIQCSEFDTIPYRKKLYTWESVFAPVTPCQLHCKPTEQFFSVVLRDMVYDGTPCRVGHRDMCISGKCEKIACDWGVNSGAKEDRCGVCHGDGSSCLTVKNQYTEKQGLGYVEATVIPKDARNIHVEEVAEANNYLALRNEKGEYFLNGHWYIQWSGDYDAAGTIVHYERSGNKESFFAPGPLKEPLYIMLLFQSQNPGIVYEYTVPNVNASAREPIFSWEYAEFTHCTLSCGGGIQRRAVTCTEVEAGPVEDQFCENLSEKPDDVIRVCNTHMCPAKWWSGPWQHCTVSCGNTGVRKRTVICARSVGPDEQIALDDRECKSVEKPKQVKDCKKQSACPYWIKGEWSQTCTGDPCDVQKRDVHCSSKSATCGHRNRPVSYRKCSNVRCGKWVVGQWSSCTQDCDTGVQVRMVRCVHGTQCSISSRPDSQQFCNQHACTPRPSTQAPPTTEAGATTVSPRYVANLEGMDATPAKTTVMIEPLSVPITEVPTSTSSFPTTTTTVATTTVTEEITTAVRRTTTERESSEKEEDFEKKSKEAEEEKDDNEDKEVVNVEKDNIGVKTPDDKLSESKTITSVRTSTIEVTSQSKITPTVSSQSMTSQSETTPTEATSAVTSSRLDDVTVKDRGTWKVLVNAGGVKQSDPRDFRWVTSRWTECDRFCGSGTKRRQVSCLNSQLRLPAPHLACSNLTRPADTAPCNEQACIPWSASEWSECNVGCGQLGIRRRIVYCTKPNQCDLQQKPTAYTSCFNHCIKWVAGSWSQCSSSCGGGEQYRHVMCINQTSYEPVQGCQHSEQPRDAQPCNQHPCTNQNAALSAWPSGCDLDIYPTRICHTLRRIGHCKQRYVQAKCCRTCGHRTQAHRRKRKLQ